MKEAAKNHSLPFQEDSRDIVILDKPRKKRRRNLTVVVVEHWKNTLRVFPSLYFLKSLYLYLFIKDEVWL